MYKAKNVDTDKALNALNEALKIQREIVEIEIKEKKAYLQGVEKGIGIAESIFQCSNYEKTEKGGEGWANIFKKLKRFYEKHFKSHCPDCNGVMDLIGWEWGRSVYECRKCKRWWV